MVIFGHIVYMKIFHVDYLKTAFRKNIAFSARVQSLIQFLFGIAIHNPWRDECCEDFSCCMHKADHCWLTIGEKQLPIRRKIWYERRGGKVVQCHKWIIFGHEAAK